MLHYRVVEKSLQVKYTSTAFKSCKLHIRVTGKEKRVGGVRRKSQVYLQYSCPVAYTDLSPPTRIFAAYLILRLRVT